MRKAPAELHGLLHKISAPQVGLHTGFFPKAFDQSGLLQEASQPAAKMPEAFRPHGLAPEGVTGPLGTNELIHILSHLARVQPAFDIVRPIIQSKRDKLFLGRD